MTNEVSGGDVGAGRARIAVRGNTRSDDLRSCWFTRSLSLLLVLISAFRPSPALAQDCAAISRYLEESLPPQPVQMRRSGESAATVIRGVFPIIPTAVRLSIMMPSGIPDSWSSLQRGLVQSALTETSLPIDLITNHEEMHILVFFYRKARTRDDSARLFSEFRSIPNRPNLFPGYAPVYDHMHFDSCWTSWVLTKDAELRDVTIFIPFESDTGIPIERARTCAREGFLKAFGVSLNRDGWTESCQDCVTLDRRIALLLLENSKTLRTRLSVSEVVKKLPGTSCN